MDLATKWEGFPIKAMLVDSWKKSLNRFHLFLVPLSILAVSLIGMLMIPPHWKVAGKELPFVIGVIVGGIVGVINSNYMYLLVRSLEKNDKTPWQELLKTAFKRVWPMAGILIWFVFMVLLFFLFFGLLALINQTSFHSNPWIIVIIFAVVACPVIIYFFYRYTLIGPVTIYETSGPRGCLRRNAQLIKGAFRGLLGVYLTGILISVPLVIMEISLKYTPQPYQMVFLIFLGIFKAVLMLFFTHYFYFIYDGLVQRENVLRGIDLGRGQI